MCLSMGDCQPMVPPNKEAVKWQYIMGFCGIFHLILCIMMMCAPGGNPMDGMMEGIYVIVLVCAIVRADYCCLLMYIINVTIQFFTTMDMVGLIY